MDNKMKFETPNLTKKNIDKIAELFPSVITESADGNGKLKKSINFDMLRQLLSEDVAEGDEAYEFTWVGKKAAIAEANKPIRKTLRPCLEESVNWDTTENLYIEGDNLEVLKLLQESYLGKAKMIYIDPPYNTGSDRFVYPDNYTMDKDDYEEQIGLFDEDDNKLFDENTENNPRFHSDWCSMIYMRLMLARNLLSDDGVIFISIDDHEQENLKKICAEVFGEQNFEGHIHWRRRHNQPNDKTKMIGLVAEHIVVFAKNSTFLKIKGVGKLDITASFSNPDNDPRGAWASKPWKVGSDQSGSHYTITTPTGKEIEGDWMGEEATYKKFVEEGRIYFPKNGDGMPRKKYYQSEREEEGQCATNWWTHELFGHNQGANDCMTQLFETKNIFSNPKPVELLRAMIKIANVKNNDIVLDFFSGSATTAHAVMQLNAEDGGHRKFIMVQLPEETNEKSEAYKAGYKNICEIGKERIRRAGYNILKELASGGCRTDGTGYGMGIDNVEEYEQLTGEIILDRGFRVLKLADSNMTNVYYSPAEYDQTMLDDLESNIKSDRTSLDLLFGCLLEWGLPLSMPYSSEEIEGVTVHTYNDGDLIACFDENISENAVKIIAKRKPLRAVFRDSSFADSPSKINVFEIFKLYAPDTRVKVI